jgi:hypothetical protein
MSIVSWLGQVAPPVYGAAEDPVPGFPASGAMSAVNVEAKEDAFAPV